MAERDPFKSEEWERFADTMRRDLIPKMRESDHIAVLSPINDKFDLVFAVQIGAAILMNKPLVMLVPPGGKPSRKLLLVADKVIEVADDQDGMRRATMELGDYIKGKGATH